MFQLRTTIWTLTIEHVTWRVCSPLFDQALQTLELWSESLRHATVWWNVTITLSVLASSSSYRNSIIKNASPALGLISDAKKENRNIILRFSERVEVFGQEKLLPLNKQSNSNTENFVFNWIMKRFFQHLPKGSGLLWTKPHQVISRRISTHFLLWFSLCKFKAISTSSPYFVRSQFDIFTSFSTLHLSNFWTGSKFWKVLFFFIKASVSS